MEAGAAIAGMLRGFEEEMLTAAVRRDPERLTALLAEDFREFGSSGVVWTQEEIVVALAGEEPAEMALEDFRGELLADGVVLVTYRARRAATETLRSSIWVKRGGEWRMLFHQGTKVAGAG